MIRICFVIGRMDVGGAQRQLITLLRGLDKTLFEITLITLFPAGRLDVEVAEIPGIDLVALDRSESWRLARRFFSLVREIRRRRPHIVHGYMASSNLLVALLKLFVPRIRVVWGIRSSYDQFDANDGHEALAFRIQNRLSFLADLVISNSCAGKETCVRHGVSPAKVIVIPNGIDTCRFRPDEELRQKTREEWGVSKNDVLIGMVARFHPVKDHPAFLSAAALVARVWPCARFVCVGDGAAGYTAELHAQARSLGICERLIWAGMRTDTAAVYNALDLYVSTSLSEAFPNVVAEAMACGVPCVVTDVGDCASLVGDTGIVVAPGHAEAIADAITGCLKQQHRFLGERARGRVRAEFTTDRLVERTTAALSALAKSCQRSEPRRCKVPARADRTP